MPKLLLHWLNPLWTATTTNPQASLPLMKPMSRSRSYTTYGSSWMPLKSILGYRFQFKRCRSCILAMRMAFKKFKEFPGKALKFVCDGYTAYNLAQQQLALMIWTLIYSGNHLTNDDPISTEYRWLKQIIERLNRTFKFSYRVTNGYGSHEGSNAHVSLFVAYYNFLRPHSYSYWQPLNSITELESLPNMPAKWQKLIELSQQLILSSQTS